MEWKPVTPQAEPDRQAITEAQALRAALMEFSQRAGHDILGPLSQAASLLALYVKRHKEQSGDDGNELLEFLQTATSRMEGLVTGIRKYMEIAGRRPGTVTVDLNEALAGARVSLAAAVSASGAVIVADPLPAVRADPDQMRALFEIVIGNSIKFRTPETAPQIEISARLEGCVAVVVVEDNGIGIEAEHREDVFQPFRRLNGREYPGQGLGLAAAKLIVTMHGGRIHADHAATGGTRIEFTVPAE